MTFSQKNQVSKLIATLVSVFLFTLTTVTHAAEKVAKTYPAVGFNKVIVDGDVVLDIDQGESEYLRAEAHVEVMSRVEVDLSGDILTLGVKGKNAGLFNLYSNNQDKVHFVLLVKSLSELKLSGVVNANIGAINQDHFKLEASGAGHTNFTQLHGDSVTIHMSGASSADIQQIEADKQTYHLNGASKIQIHQPSKANQVEIEVEGASKLDAKALTVDTAKIETSGASSVDITVSDQLTAEASGVSNINYYGNAKAKVQSSGASHINAKGQ